MQPIIIKGFSADLRNYLRLVSHLNLRYLFTSRHLNNTEEKTMYAYCTCIRGETQRAWLNGCETIKKLVRFTLVCVNETTKADALFAFGIQSIHTADLKQMHCLNSGPRHWTRFGVTLCPLGTVYAKIRVIV